MFQSRPQDPMQLGELLKAAAPGVRKDILLACIVYPRTNSELLQNGRPAVTITQDTLDLQAVIEAIQSNTELLALSAVTDVQLTLRVLIDVKDSAYLDQFDTIQIYRGGMNLLRIVNRLRHVNRSAQIEIDDYRRRLYKAVSNPSQSPFLLVTMSILAGALAYALFLSGKKLK